MLSFNRVKNLNNYDKKYMIIFQTFCLLTTYNYEKKYFEKR